MQLFERWRHQYLDNPQVVFLVLFLGLIFSLIVFAGNIFAPIITSLIIAYVLDGGVTSLKNYGLSRTASLSLIYLLFVVLVVTSVFWIVPLLSQQVATFLGDLPAMIARGRESLMQLPHRYPEYVNAEYINHVMSGLRNEIMGLGQRMLSVSLSSVAGFISLLIYVVLVPLMIFFFLKDKERLLQWFKGFLPKKEDQELTLAVWSEVNLGIAGYVRGKLIEILIVWGVSWVVFAVLGLKYAPLLSFLAGISVIIPFIGAAVVAIPVIMVAYAQWGFDTQFFYVVAAYVILQFLDGNILVPILFSEVVNLHPVAIIGAVLVFGGIWGLWGVFFAIPLATLVNAILKAWPRHKHRQAPA